MNKNHQAKIFKTGIFVGLSLFVLTAVEDWLAGGLYASANPAIWKDAITQNWWIYSVIFHVIVGLVLTLVYSIFYNSLPNNKCERGLHYGFWIWLVGTVPGLIITLMYMAVPEELVIVWMVSGLFNYLIAGLLIGLIYNPEKEKIS